MLGLLVAVAVLATLATRLAVPSPILLVLGGSALGFVPGLPPVELDPELVFLLFLPPLLYVSALFTSWRDFRANVRPITLLAVGLVLMTTFVVASVAHTVVGLPWGAAFVLGAIVSPTDAISVWEAGLQFVVGAAGGVAAGFAVGWLVVWARRHLSEDPSVQNSISLLTPFVAYLAAEELPHSLWGLLHDLFGVPGDLYFSGVLAVVTTGLYLGRKGPYIISSGTRLQGYATWELITFLLNGLIFILIGLQLRSVVEGLDDYTAGQLVYYALLTSLTVILVRMVWVFPATYVPRWASRRIRERDPSPPWRSVSVIAWTGMRGVISLAAALALPLQTASGVPFPDRDLTIFLTFCVILATLVVQGLSLPVLIRALGLEDDRIGDKEETHGRISIAEAALERLDELVDEDWVREDTAERIRSLYSYRRNRFASRFDGDPEGVEVRSAAYQRLMAELLGAQRLRLIMMRDEGSIGDEVMHRIERDLDLEESRMEL